MDDPLAHPEDLKEDLAVSLLDRATTTTGATGALLQEADTGAETDYILLESDAGAETDYIELEAT
jgi:hypothetical protein